jgi:hypothetical protein
MSSFRITRGSEMPRWLWMPVLLGALVPTGCGEDSPAGAPDPGEPVREFWQGTYVSRDQTDHGSFVLDIVRTGLSVTGEVVFRSRVEETPFDHLFVKGTGGEDHLKLDLNHEVVDYPYRFTVDASVTSRTGLAGTLFYSPSNLTADITCRKIPVGSVTVESEFDIPEAILGLAFDGDQIWASTLSDYVRMNADGAILGRVVVFYGENSRWTSDALTSDGTHLWGHLPRTVIDQTGTHNLSAIIEFTKDGTITKEFEVPHRTSGLAAAGGELWSLPIDSEGFRRFDDTGSILESVDVFLPDLADLEYDGTCFWSIGWFLNRLYQVDRTGAVVRVYDMPKASGIVFPAAIAHDGANFWYAVGGFDSNSRIYKIHVDS